MSVDLAGWQATKVARARTVAAAKRRKVKEELGRMVKREEVIKGVNSKKRRIRL